MSNDKDSAVLADCRFLVAAARAWWAQEMPNSRLLDVRFGGDGRIDVLWRDKYESGKYTLPENFMQALRQPTQSDALRDQLLQECLVKLRDVQGTEAPKQYACNLIKRIERVLQEASNAGR
jgi:hypothetical protein